MNPITELREIHALLTELRGLLIETQQAHRTILEETRQLTTTFDQFGQDVQGLTTTVGALADAVAAMVTNEQAIYQAYLTAKASPAGADYGPLDKSVNDARDGISAAIDRIKAVPVLPPPMGVPVLPPPMGVPVVPGGDPAPIVAAAPPLAQGQSAGAGQTVSPVGAGAAQAGTQPDGTAAATGAIQGA